MAAFLLFGGFSSCVEDLSEDDHYKAPDWLKGNAYEVLQGEGNHGIFLRAVDLSDYKSVVAGKSVVTVMAPDDKAFTDFLTAKGCNTIDELNEKDHDYLNKLVGYHIMYYAYDWNKMVNFRTTDGDAASEEEKEVKAGYNYKHRTRSIDPIEKVRVKLTPNASSDTLINLYHYERYLPVLSNKMFETKGIDAAYNYKYFFPETEWNGRSGGKGGFNVANANVKDADNVVTDNGYLYHVDHVLEPLKTIYDELADNANYSQFLSLYDRYSTYEPADEETVNSLGYQVYVHSHGSLPPIAWEWPVLSWKSTALLEHDGYNVFAPSNKAMDEFFSSYWTQDGGYLTLNDLDPLIVQLFIQQSFSKENFIVFPEEIKAGKVLTGYGTPVDIDPEMVTYRKMCSNGTLYGMDKMDPPAVFSSVLAPAFKDKNYITYLYVLAGSGNMLPLASDKTQFVTLVPNSGQFTNADPAIRLYETTSGRELQEWSNDLGDFAAMGSGSMNDIMQMHTAQNISVLGGKSLQVVETNKQFNYWFVKSDGDKKEITTNALFNEQLQPGYAGTPFVALHHIKNQTSDDGAWNNGNSYSYDAESIFKPASGDGLGHSLAVCQDKNFSYYLFAQLLQKAGLTTANSLAASIVGVEDRFFVFIPTNDAIAANLSNIPGCGKLTVKDGALSGTVSAAAKTELANYLRSYFVSSLINSFTAYPYVGSSCNGEFRTQGAETLNITDTGSGLKVNFKGSGTSAGVVSDYDCLPFVFNDGCFHLIDGILLQQDDK